MNNGIFVGLVYNAALLLMMGIIFDSITLTTYKHNFITKILSGASLGLVAIAIMSQPWVSYPGVVFDTRSILLSLVAMFFSLTPTIIVTIIAILYRIWQAGSGTAMGIAVIVFSITWGLIWKKYHSRWRNPYGFLELYTLGFVNHVSMLAMTIFLPNEIQGKVLNSIAIPVIIIYPIVTVFLGQIMSRRAMRRKELQALEESEKHYRNLYDKAPIAYQSLDNDGNYIEVNQIWLDIMGYPKSEVIGRNFTEFLHPDFKSHFVDNFPRFKANGSITGVEFTLLTKGGAEVLVSYNGVILCNDDGSFKQTQCVFKDITQIRKQEAALRSIEWMLTKKEVDNETYISYGDLTKLNTNRLILDSVGKEVLEEIVRDYLLLMDTSAAIYEKNGDYALGLFSSSWCRFLDSQSRELCDTDDNAEALNSGKWLCHESCWTDVSKTAIETGNNVDRKCAGGLHLYAVPIVTSTGVIGAINMGYGTPPEDEASLEEIAGKYQVDVNDLKKQAATYLSRPAFVIEQAKRKLHTSAKLIAEIVERKRAEQDLEQRIEERTSELQLSNTELEAFSYSVAHDLRAPLRSISGFSNILAEDYTKDLDSAGQKLLKTIQVNVDRMDILISGLLDLAKLSRNSIRRVVVDMRKLATAEFYDNHDTGITSMFDFEIGEIADAYVDHVLMGLVWQNLIGNAVKFSMPCPNKKIIIHSEYHGDEIIYSIQDFGVGFDMKYVDKVFGVFQRLHREDEFQGTGIGLAIAHKIITRHNGRIWVNSSLGRGTIFYFALPVYSV